MSPRIRIGSGHKGTPIKRNKAQTLRCVSDQRNDIAQVLQLHACLTMVLANVGKPS